MQSSGRGLTFTDNEVLLAKRLLGFVNKGTYTVNAIQTIEAGQALVFLRDLIPQMEANVFEILDQVKVPEASKEVSG